ncbi:MAG: type I-B CRISPR-associated endonuclease Cas1 [Magnetococcales bacterium]|nr:type I-B CRISPR-associated endonuclease Cas1 [Nitrospirota bacterium]
MDRPYYISSNGRIKRMENTVVIENEKGDKKAIPIEDIDTIHLFGEIDLNSKLLNFLSKHNTTIHFYNYYGFYTGSFMPPHKSASGELTVRQVQHYLDPAKRLAIAVGFVQGSLFHLQRNLRRHKGTEEFRDIIDRELKHIESAGSVAELMGCEGRARNAYYQALNVVMVADGFSFDKRQKRPPTNPVNALISFGNSLMYTHVLTNIYHTQLNPTISYLHEPSQRRYSLSLDIADIFKPLIADTVMFKLVNNRMLTEEDFEEDVDYCYLTEVGRKKYLRELDEKLNTTVQHRKLKRKVSYSTLIRLECYKLIKHLLGDEEYVPLKAWW